MSLVALLFLIGLAHGSAAVPTLSINNVTVMAPASGTTNAVFTVSLSDLSDQVVTVKYATANVSAAAGKDYVSTNGTLTFNPGETNKAIPVVVNAQTINQPVKTFVVNLTNAVNATVLVAQGTGAILNNVPPPTMGITDSVVTAPSTGLINAIFRVSLSGPSGLPVAVNYSTVNGTAIAGRDFIQVSGTLSFSPGQTFKTISVSIYPAAIGQPTKTFVINLTNSVNATIVGSQGSGTIINTLTLPTLAISNVTVTVPTNATTNALFIVSLSAPSAQTVNVDYSTADGNAVAGSDYVAANGTLTFNPGETTKTVPVVVNAQTVNQAARMFVVNLANPVNATILAGQATGTILTGIGLPTLSLNSVSVTAPANGTNNVLFTVSLSAPSGQIVSINYATVDGSAVAGNDYVAANGTLTFNPGDTNQTIAVVINAQTVNQPAKTFAVTLTNSVNATILVGLGTGTILSALTPPTLSLNSVTLAAPASGSSNALFTVSLSAPSGQMVSVNYATADGNAMAGKDYIAANGTLTFNPGETTKTISVVINAQTVNQPARIFVVNLSNPVNATILAGQGPGTILAGIAPPTLSVDSVTATASAGGTAYSLFSVDLSAPSGQTVSVNYTTADQSAVAGKDYVSTNGTLTFNPGETNQTIPVLINPQTVNQPTLIFLVNLDNPVNATILAGQGIGTILTAVAPPTASVDSVTVTAPTSGTINAVFTVTLSVPTAQTVSINYATTDGTAAAGKDYVTANGTLTFNPGETSKTISVVINAQTLTQPGRTFVMSLSGAVNANVLAGQGVGTILNGVVVPMVTIQDVNVTAPATNTTDAGFQVTLSAPTSQAVSVNYSTADGTAIAGSDYLATNGVLSFNPGQTNATITVKILPQTILKLDNVFFVNLTNATNATVARSQAQGRIAIGNLPPTVRILSPASDATFPPGSDISVEIGASDPDGTVRRVDLYVGTTLLATLTNSPYSFTWNSVSVGDYFLKAIATDNAGASTVSSNIHIAVTGVTGDVAIVHNAEAAEITTLQDYVLEMGYSSRVFRPAELTAAAAGSFQLLIWDDTGASPSGLTDSLVTVLYQAFTNGTPLYLIGDNLTAAATNLSVGQRMLWTDLIHLQASAGSGGHGTITVSDPSSHPVSNGRFGLVAGFSYPLQVRPTSQSSGGGNNGAVLATSGDADVLIAFPSDSSSPDVRSVSQCFLVSNGTDADSIAARKALFQNAVCWLVRCPLCDLTDMSLEMTADSSSTTSGSKLTYTLLVQKFAECEGTGVKVKDLLPPNVQFVTATSPFGTWTYQNGVVLFSLGHFGNGASMELTITVIPTNTLAVTNTATVSANEGDPNLSNNTQTLVTPGNGSSLQLYLSALTNGSYQVDVTGLTGGNAFVQSSSNLLAWTTLTNLATTNSTIQFIDATAAQASRRFYRVLLP